MLIRLSYCSIFKELVKPPLVAATYLLYHARRCLSRGFSKFSLIFSWPLCATPFREPIHYITSFRICQAVFLKKLNFSFYRPPPKRCDLGKLIYYITSVRFCQVFFSKFLKNFFDPKPWYFFCFASNFTSSRQLLYYTLFFAICHHQYCTIILSQFSTLLCTLFTKIKKPPRTDLRRFKIILPRPWAPK